MASIKKITRTVQNAVIDDPGELTLEQLTDRSGCSNETADLALVGDDYTLNRFLATRGETSLALPEQLLPSYELAGDFVDVGRYLSGEPECMFSYDSQVDSAQFVDVTIRIGRPCSTPSERLFKYYTNVLHAIDILEAKGLRCRITATFDCVHTNEVRRVVFKTPIKEYHEPINMAVFAGVILNNRFFTKVVLPFVDRHYERYMTCFMYCTDMIDLEVLQFDHTITFPSMYFNNYSDQTDFAFDNYMKVIGLGYLLEND